MHHKPVTLLKALLDGQEVELEGQKWAMSFDGKLCVVPESGLGENQGLVVDMDVSQFCKMAEKMTSDQAFLLGVNNALQGMKKRGI